MFIIVLKTKRMFKKHKSILVCVLLIIIFSAILILILNPFLAVFFKISNNDSVQGLNNIELFVFSVILAPFIETLFFLFVPMKIFENRNINKIGVGIVATILFALTHCYSLNYVFFSFFMGLYLLFAFFLFTRKTNINTAFWAVSVVHLLNNLYFFLLATF